MKTLEKIENEFKSIVKTIDSTFEKGYAVKNPGLVQHLLDKVQQQEDRAIIEKINSY